ncbi:unnamed protein product, partial [marine sediment metagenome]
KTAEVAEHFRKVLDDLVSAVAEENEPEFARHMGIANRRLAAGENENGPPPS